MKYVGWKSFLVSNLFFLKVYIVELVNIILSIFFLKSDSTVSTTGRVYVVVAVDFFIKNFVRFYICEHLFLMENT